MKNIDDLTPEELNNIATDEQKFQAFNVAIDAYDKEDTYIEELRKILKKYE